MTKNLKKILLLGSCFILSACFESEAPQNTETSQDTSGIEESVADISTGEIGHAVTAMGGPFVGSNLAGQYLASQFAQNRHDWKTASQYLNEILQATPGQNDLIKKSMILAAGSGDINTAITLAKQLKKGEDTGALAPLFEFSSLFKDKKYDESVAYIQTMPQAGLAEFIYPLLTGWTEAARGNFQIDKLQSNTVHLKHAALIADVTGHKDQIEALLVKSMSAANISLEEVETIADGFAYLGKAEQAEKLYAEVLKQTPHDEHVIQKIADLKTAPEKNFKGVKTAEEGMGLAIYDMAKLLYQENSDDSARIFAYLASYINPANQDVSLLLGAIATRNEQYDEAITYYRSIDKNHQYYLEAQRLAAEVLERAGRTDEALKVLQDLSTQNDDVRSLIAIGDIYRNKDDFTNAVNTYNEAEQKLRKQENQAKLQPDFWHLHYVRGMAQEQAGNWDAAEKDLQEALKIEPNHPFVLNYLGYAWADKGIHLDDSLAMIQKAADLQPDDGYIVDSLGWVFYKLGRYQEAIPHLEKAVELLPYDPTINDHLGDAYWRVGRKLEARFQWERAQNHSEDEKMISTLKDKLQNGLAELEVSKHADAAKPL